MAKVYEVDPFVCPKRGYDMKVAAVIEAHDEIRRILRHLVKTSIAAIDHRFTNRFPRGDWDSARKRQFSWPLL